MELTLGLRWAIEICRSAKPGLASSFVGGEPVALTELASFIPAPELADLYENDLINVVDHQAQLGVRCSNHNNLVSVMPAHQQIGAEYVHVNADTFWLRHLIWKHTSPGEYAVELGAGNAILAAHLVARYRRVIATDLPGVWLEYAQLTLAANAGRGRPSAVVACDVGSALRPESFDLVATNAPWSPAVPLDDDGKEMTFMAGGPTGTELPARFLREGATLLRPGGTAITLCLDPEFEDGSRPLMSVLDELRIGGYQVECVDSQIFDPAIVTERLRQRRLPTLKHARHLAVIVNRADI